MQIVDSEDVAKRERRMRLEEVQCGGDEERRVWDICGRRWSDGAVIIRAVSTDYDAQRRDFVYHHLLYSHSLVTGAWRELGRAEVLEAKVAAYFVDEREEQAAKVGLLGFGGKSGRTISFRYLLLDEASLAANVHFGKAVFPDLGVRQSEADTLSLGWGSASGWFTFVHGQHRLIRLKLAEESFQFEPLLDLFAGDALPNTQILGSTTAAGRFHVFTRTTDEETSAQQIDLTTVDVDDDSLQKRLYSMEVREALPELANFYAKLGPDAVRGAAFTAVRRRSGRPVALDLYGLNREEKEAALESASPYSGTFWWSPEASLPLPDEAPLIFTASLVRALPHPTGLAVKLSQRLAQRQAGDPKAPRPSVDRLGLFRLTPPTLLQASLGTMCRAFATGEAEASFVRLLPPRVASEHFPPAPMEACAEEQTPRKKASRMGKLFKMFKS